MGVLNSIKGGVNLAGNIINTLADNPPIKQFYSLRDFYNFIRKEQNCPMAHSNFFTVVPEINTKGLLDGAGEGIGNNLKALAKGIGNSITNTVNGLASSLGLGKDGKQQTSDTNLFAFDENNLARFALAINTINVPTTFGFTSIQSVQSPYGQYTYFKNNKDYFYSTGGSNNISFTFIQMADPIIQSFIVPWMIQLQKNTFNTDSKDTRAQALPTLNLTIKFYRADEICGMDFMMNPTFIYRITNLFPKTISLVKPKHGRADSLQSRSVTFAFDNFMVFPNATYEKLITGSKQHFAYDKLSPVQILNKLNYQGAAIGSIVSQVKNTF